MKQTDRQLTEHRGSAGRQTHLGGGRRSNDGGEGDEEAASEGGELHIAKVGEVEVCSLLGCSCLVSTVVLLTFYMTVPPQLLLPLCSARQYVSIAFLQAFVGPSNPC